MNRSLFFLLLVIYCICIVGYLVADYYFGQPIDTTSSYVGRESCASCHQDQVDLFRGSHHDLAMDVATDQSVLADFADQTIEHYGVSSRMFRDGERFMVHTEGPDGEMADFEVKYVFGVEPLQQYMVELERPDDATDEEVGRVQVLRLSWDTKQNKWFYLSPPDVTDKLDSNDPLHWTGVTQNWNVSCAECHSTDLKKNFDLASNSWKTTFSEVDVSCEACHGPAGLHVEIAQNKGLFWDRHHGFGLANLKTDNNLDQIESCAPCHSRRGVIQEGFKPGCNFDDYYALQTLTEPIYYADGQIRDEDYVHGSFSQSKMYHAGIKCSDCHDPHSLKLKHNGNNVCTSCHQHPAGKYDTENHHHHKPGTPGASCVECHMPATTYMMVDARRDHSFRVPRPDLSVRLGTPNACTGCHLETETIPPSLAQDAPRQYLDWLISVDRGNEEVTQIVDRVDAAMAEATMKWYPPESSPAKTKYYESLAEGQSAIAASASSGKAADSSEDNGFSIMEELALDISAPAIVRATAAENLASSDQPSTLETAMQALGDEDSKVVASALYRIEAEIGRIRERQIYSQNPGPADNEIVELAKSVAGLLEHDAFRVRLEACRVLTTIAPGNRQSALDSPQRKAFSRLVGDYERSLMLMPGRAGTHMVLGALHERMGNLERAMEDYRNATIVEPGLAGPRSNLAQLIDVRREQLESQLHNVEGGEVSIQQYETVTRQAKVLTEQAKKLRDEEYQNLKRDIERSQGLPNTFGIHYRFAMASFLQGDLEKAEEFLLSAYQQRPLMANHLLGLATFYLHQKMPGVAEKYVEELLGLDSDHPGYLALEKQMKEMQAKQ
jgi:tetratricopeptide (TPR) repeat protein/nitrate/TMAO reductase-like tetraheme cytochrome c subunit